MTQMKHVHNAACPRCIMSLLKQLMLYMLTADPPVVISVFILLLTNCSKCFKNFEEFSGTVRLNGLVIV